MPDLFDFTEPMKAITLWQPWASLIAHGVKRHETRHWATSYRGAIAIHAGKTIDTVGAPEALCVRVLGEHWARTVPIGMVVAVARVADCRPTDKMTEADVGSDDWQAGNYLSGRFAWRLENVIGLARPVPAIGRQGLFNWTPPSDLAAHLHLPRAA